MHALGIKSPTKDTPPEARIRIYAFSGDISIQALAAHH